MSGFTPKQIAEQKLKAFSIGAMGKTNKMTKKEEEEKRKREEEALIGNVYKEFEEHFDDRPTSKINKTWVKAGTFNAGNRKEDTSGKGQLYKPTSKLAELAESFTSRKKALEDAAAAEARKNSELSRPERPGKKKEHSKKKSNLEIFKDELKAIQEEREERHKYKAMIRAGGAPIPGRSLLDIPPGGALGDILADTNGDPSSTNIYLGNISPKLSESQLTQLFGRFGPLASIKIMYPRTDEERSRGKNCGFVAYMSRTDGERAMAALLGKTIEGHEMRMGWGKPIPLPIQPIYVPPALQKYIMPPAPSGLPFNCQPDKRDADDWGLDAVDNPRPCEVPTDSRGKRAFDKMLTRAFIKVVIPTDRTQVCLINRMIEFVIREGPIFEATIMNRELNNPQFRFLFENQSPEHIYYRWRLYSLLQGDSKDQWHTREFRMFKGGSVWRPPLPNVFTSGVPADLLDSDGACIDPVAEREHVAVGRKPTYEPPAKKPVAPILPGKKPLSDSQRDSLESTLRSLMPERNGIAEAMVWCIEHADSGDEVIECLAESLSILETPVVKKIARLFLISDILHNCTVKGIPNVSFYRTGFQAKLPEIFGDLNASYQKIESRIKAEAFKQRVMACFRAWEDWALYPMDYLIKLQNIFLGLVTTVAAPEDKESEPEEASGSDEDVDGVPLDGAALLKGARPLHKKPPPPTRPDSASEESLDGEPLGELAAKVGGGGSASPPPAAPAPKPAGFVSSKWETVDPEQVKAQAVTTSKWEREEADDLMKARKALMGAVASKWEDQEEGEDSLDGEPLGGRGDIVAPIDARAEEERRQILREIEVKVMSYQDDLENGEKGIKAGWSIQDQVEHYRKKLLRKALEDTEAPTPRGKEKSSRAQHEEPLSDSERYSSRSSKKEKRKKKRDRSSSESRSPSTSRDRNRSKERNRKRKKSRERSLSSSPGDRRKRSRSVKRTKRSRSRSSQRKHKKKRH